MRCRRGLLVAFGTGTALRLDEWAKTHHVTRRAANDVVTVGFKAMADWRFHSFWDDRTKALWPEYFPVSGFVLAETGSVSFTVIVSQWWCFSMTGLISNVDKW